VTPNRWLCDRLQWRDTILWGQHGGKQEFISTRPGALFGINCGRNCSFQQHDPQSAHNLNRPWREQRHQVVFGPQGRPFAVKSARPRNHFCGPRGVISKSSRDTAREARDTLRKQESIFPLAAHVDRWGFFCAFVHDLAGFPSFET
jgi:hypothetical protein